VRGGVFVAEVQSIGNGYSARGRWARAWAAVLEW